MKSYAKRSRWLLLIFTTFVIIFCSIARVIADDENLLHTHDDHLKRMTIQKIHKATDLPKNISQDYSRPLNEKSRPASSPHKSLRNGKRRHVNNKTEIISECHYKDGKKHGSCKTYYLSGELRSKVKFKDDYPYGVEKFYYKDGSLKERTLYRDGKRHGLCKKYYSNGDIEEIIRYSRGYPKLEKKFYENGTLKSIFDDGIHKEYETDGRLRTVFKSRIFKMTYTYEEGKQIGIYQEFYLGRRGIIAKEERLVDNRREGFSKIYYKSGELQSKVLYANDKPVGVHEFYRKDGTLESTKEYLDQTKRESIIVREYDQEEKLTRETHYSNEKKNGLDKVFYDSGELLSQLTYRNNKPRGQQEIFCKDGTRMKEFPFKNNKVHGLASVFYPSGELELEIHYVKGQKQEVKRFQKNGSIKELPAYKIAFQTRQQSYYIPYLRQEIIDAIKKEPVDVYISDISFHYPKKIVPVEKYQRYVNPRWSNDGDKLYFVGATPQLGSRECLWDIGIFMSDPEGNHVERIASKEMLSGAETAINTFFNNEIKKFEFDRLDQNPQFDPTLHGETVVESKSPRISPDLKWEIYHTYSKRKCIDPFAPIKDIAAIADDWKSPKNTCSKYITIGKIATYLRSLKSSKKIKIYDGVIEDQWTPDSQFIIDDNNRNEIWVIDLKGQIKKFDGANPAVQYPEY